MESVSQQNPTLDKLPPHDGLAERAVLGCCLGGSVSMVDGEMAKALAAIERCQAQFGSDEVFYDLAHLAIWNAITFLKARDGRLDVITVQAELKARGLLEQVGGYAYLSQCQDAAVSPSMIEDYLRLVWEKFVARRLIQKNSEQTAAVMESGELTESKIANIQLRHEEWVRLTHRGTVQPKNLSFPNEFAEAYYNQFFDRKEDEYGYRLPFEYTLRLRPGETTLFTGDNGSGKTSMLSLMAICVAAQLAEGERVVVASMEMRPEVTLWIMARQLMGLGKLERTEENIHRIVRALAWLNKRVVLYNFWGITDKNDLLNTFHYAAEHHGGKFFIIDNMMKVGIADDDYAAQGYFIQGVCGFSMKWKAHTVVVVHENKGDGSMKQKVRGSKQLTDAPDNVVKMERNEKKAQELIELKQEEAARSKAPEVIREAREKLRKVWDSKFTHSKQRYPGTNQNGARWLYFHHETLQFHVEPNQGAIDFTLTQ